MSKTPVATCCTCNVGGEPCGRTAACAMGPSSMMLAGHAVIIKRSVEVNCTTLRPAAARQHLSLSSFLLYVAHMPRSAHVQHAHARNAAYLHAVYVALQTRRAGGLATSSAVAANLRKQVACDCAALMSCFMLSKGALLSCP